MTVWLKLTLLLIYLAVLFILARLLEAVAWYEQGHISRRLLDPMALSVLKLKALLEQRGVTYDNIVEKSELKQLVETTGPIADEDVELTSSLLEEPVTVTNYTGDMDFYEQVEDAKDSMWLVEVVTDTGGLLSDTSWNLIQRKLGKFGVRFGRFDCQLNVRLCMRKQWFTSRLILALPENYRTKANVVLHSYSGPVRVNSLFDWVKSKVNSQIKSVDDVKTLERDWLNFESSLSPEVRVLFVSTFTSIPLFISALSVKFPGRVKIGKINVKSENGKDLAKKVDMKSSPAYIVITAERKYIYGFNSGERLTFRAMEIFLKSLYPSLNDLFIISIICTNIASCFEVSLYKGHIIKRVVHLALCLFKYNLVLLLIWILLLAILQIPVLETLSLLGLKGLRLCTSTTLFSFIRKDIIYYSDNWAIPVSILAIIIILSWYIKTRYFGDNSETEEETDWWNFSNLQTLDYEQWWELTRLRPFDQIFNPTVGVLSMGADALDINQTFVSKEYIKHLPTWVNHDPENVDQQVKDCKMLKSDAHENQDTYAGKIQQNKGEYNENVLNKIACAGLARSLVDSNYRCECGQECSCSWENTRRNQHPENHNVNPHTTEDENPSIGPEDASLEPPIDDPFIEFAKSYEVENLNKLWCKPDGYLDSTQCVICLENYKTGELLRGLPCSHSFHDKCILAWLMRENHFCPVCRWPSYQPKVGHLYNDLHND